ncbi:hypothetical protein TNIN_306741 [Trichonephila inaurata madagascariensis]|uniref:Uncharacterized protein n=1 Tax=Trichonephila inaurata madagascariensis TaxID=2747483 RepID=A0A8X6X2S5_9ARAC|nr:hypothetical protein TNIN_306741 [Trichonephila inaurata madagascariensis]
MYFLRSKPLTMQSSIKLAAVFFMFRMYSGIAEQQIVTEDMISRFVKPLVHKSYNEILGITFVRQYDMIENRLQKQINKRISNVVDKVSDKKRIFFSMLL